MILLGENLLELINKYNMVEDKNCFDNTCITLGLDKSIIYLKPSKHIDTLTYGLPIPEECIIRENIGAKGLRLKPKETVLACSYEKIFIPKGYMGFVQTKGSLARLFVFAHCCDAQIDSGYRGKITLELFNASDFNIILHSGQKIVNLYVFKASTKNVIEYNGKYQNALFPTIQTP